MPKLNYTFGNLRHRAADALAAALGASGVARVYERRGYARAPEGDLDKTPEVFLDAFVLRLPK